MNLEKLQGHLSSLQDRFHEVELLITDPEVLADEKRYVQLSKEYKHLQKLNCEYENISKPRRPLLKRKSLSPMETTPR